MEREKATLGVLITMQEPTRPMRAEAAAAGLYTSAGWHKSYPCATGRIAILARAHKAAVRAEDAPDHLVHGQHDGQHLGAGAVLRISADRYVRRTRPLMAFNMVALLLATFSDVGSALQQPAQPQPPGHLLDDVVAVALEVQLKGYQRIGKRIQVFWG